MEGEAMQSKSNERKEKESEIFCNTRAHLLSISILHIVLFEAEKSAKPIPLREYKYINKCF